MARNTSGNGGAEEGKKRAAANRGWGEGGIRQRPDGRWEATLELGLVNGKRKRKWFYGDTKREVLQKLAKARRDLEQGLTLAPERLTVAKFLTTWLEGKRGKRPKTYRHYEQTVRLHLIPDLGHHHLAKLGPQHVQAMLNARAAGGASPRSVFHMRAVLRNALNQALTWGLIGRNPASPVDLPHISKRELPAISPAQLTRFLQTIAEHRLGILFLTTIALGFREGEMLGLRWQDLDLDGGLLHLRRQVQRVEGKLQFLEVKTAGSRHTVPLPPTLVQLFQRHRQRQLEERQAFDARWQDGDLVFPSMRGTPLEPRNALRALYILEARAELPKLTFHDLRHLTSTLLISQGADPKLIQEQLGHSDVSVTLGIYGHLMPGAQVTALEGLARHLVRQTDHRDEEAADMHGIGP
jgi:integrase